MNIFKFLVDRFLQKRPFFYGWEQRAFERRQEQYGLWTQSSCRLGKD
ncbi:hypothetical protein QJS83_03430 [Bdellovibrio sp. 22V]|nr:hypothetical protein [Bdellovibrio sp. 22V]WII72922.1 hypothetical protein QJS83_03430 [Bdellovibrio sp. 22V]